jgi:hypothetical protein
VFEAFVVWASGLVWLVSTEKNEFEHIWFGPRERGAALVMVVRHCRVGHDMIYAAMVLVFQL